MTKFKKYDVVGSKKFGRRWGTIIRIPEPGYIVQWLNKQREESVHSEVDLYKEKVDEDLICYTCKNIHDPQYCKPKVKKWNEWLNSVEEKSENIDSLREPTKEEIKELNRICFACLHFKEWQKSIPRK